jgi:hypothetical protein
MKFGIHVFLTLILTHFREELRTPAILTSGNAPEPISDGFHSQHEHGGDTELPTLTGTRTPVFLLLI